MNYAELQTAILSDSHKENYSSEIARFIQQGEALIFARLEAYGLETTLDDTDRTAPSSPIYNLPDKIAHVRYISIGDNPPLELVDETAISMYRTLADVQMFSVRPTTVKFAGNPGAGTILNLQYFGMPAALLVTPNNKLLDDFPQLYIEAAQIYVFKRAQDYESAQIAHDSTKSLIDDINRKVRKQLGGAKSANAYNVAFRSSY